MAAARVELGHRLQGESPLVEARMRNDQVVLGIGHAQAVERQDVDVDHPRPPAPPLRITAQRRLEALELDQQVDRRQVGLELQGGVEEVRLIDPVARRAVVQRGDLHHLTDGAQLRDRRAEGDGRLAEVSTQTDEGAHASRTLTDCPTRSLSDWPGAVPTDVNFPCKLDEAPRGRRRSRSIA